MNPKRAIIKIYDFTLDSLAFLAAFLIVFAMISVSVDVFSRFFFNAPIGWVLEITEYILLYIPFLGATWLLREDGHVNVDVIYNLLNPKNKRIVRICTSIACSIICAILAYWGTITTWDHFRRGIVNIEILRVPKWIIIIVIPVGFFLLSIEFLRKTYKNIKNSIEV